MSGKTGEDRVQVDFWPKLARNLWRLPFAEQLVAGYFCAFDKATPLKVKATLIAALAYFILPFDAVPDLLLGLGFTDDLAVLATAIGVVRNSITPTHRELARQKLAELKASAKAASSS
jgi:uncharacterized membrane protein YkvA (DUF1232 family)